MDLAAIADAPLAIQIHLVTVLPAFVIGTWLLFVSRKGSPGHRALGRLYLALMTVTALDTLFIRSLRHGALSSIHLLIPVTLFAVARALISIRRGDVRGHRRAMLLLYVGGMVVAGGFTLVPGRLMHRVLFGQG